MTFLALIPLFAHATDITLPVVGHVTDPAGQPIQGTHAVTVALWADEAASISLHTEAPVVGFADGTFAVVLGQTGDLTVDDLASAPEVWLTIQLDDGARSTPARLGYAPFAAIAARAASLGDLAPEDVAVVPAAGPCGPDEAVTWDGARLVCVDTIANASAVAAPGAPPPAAPCAVNEAVTWNGTALVCTGTIANAINATNATNATNAAVAANVTTSPADGLSAASVAMVGNLYANGVSPGGAGYGVVPSGAVLPFNLASCPAGWTDLTSTMAGRTIVGVGAYSNTYNPGGRSSWTFSQTYGLNDAGGFATWRQSVAEIASHNHGGLRAQTAHTIQGSGNDLNVALGGGNSSMNATYANGSDSPMENRMPWRAFLYCRKN